MIDPSKARMVGVARDGSYYELRFNDPGMGDELDMVVTVVEPTTGKRVQCMGAVVYRDEVTEYMTHRRNAEIEETLRLLLG